MAKLKTRNITDLKFDSKNINVGTKSGKALLSKSIAESGIGRSVLTDKNDVLIGGNKTVEQAIALGIRKVIEVETNGDELVVVKRKDLDINTEKGIKAKIFDNTVSVHNYVEDAEIIQVVCEEADIMNIHEYGLGHDLEIGEDVKQQVSFSASTKTVIKIELTDKSELASAVKDINYLMNKKYPGAIVTAKGLQQ